MTPAELLAREIDGVKRSDVMPDLVATDGFLKPDNPVKLSEIGAYDDVNRGSIRYGQSPVDERGLGHIVPVPQLPAALWAFRNGIKTYGVSGVANPSEPLQLVLSIDALTADNIAAVKAGGRGIIWDGKSRFMSIDVMPEDFPGQDLRDVPIRKIQEVFLQRIKSVFKPQTTPAFRSIDHGRS